MEVNYFCITKQMDLLELCMCDSFLLLISHKNHEALRIIPDSELTGPYLCSVLPGPVPHVLNRGTIMALSRRTMAQAWPYH